jgi:type IV pilus assembly protein PilP
MNARFRRGSRVAAVRGAVVLGVALAVLAGCARRDMADLRQFVETTKRTTPIKKPDPPPEIKPYTPFAYTAQEVKDPFILAPFAQEEELGMLAEGGGRAGGACTASVRPDPNRVREELEKYSLGSVKMMGTLRMGGDNELWALVLAPDGVVHRVQKKNYLGANHGQIVNITEQRIDLREIVPDKPGCWQERDAFLSLTQ